MKEYDENELNNGVDELENDDSMSKIDSDSNSGVGNDESNDFTEDVSKYKKKKFEAIYAELDDMKYRQEVVNNLFFDVQDFDDDARYNSADDVFDPMLEEVAKKWELVKTDKEVKSIEPYSSFRIAKDAVRLNYGLADAKYWLEQFQLRFMMSQKNPKANTDDPSLTEGPKDYVSIMTKINSLIKDMNGVKSNNLTIENFCDKFNDIVKDTQKYLKKHYPRFRGHRSEESAKRYEVMQSFMASCQVQSDSFNTVMSEMAGHMKEAELTNIDIKKINCNDLRLKGAGIAAVKNGIVNSDININDFYKRAAIAENERYSEERYQALINRVKKVLLKATNNDPTIAKFLESGDISDLVPKKYLEPDFKKAAMCYVVYTEFTKITNMHNKGELTEIPLSCRVANIEAEINKLSINPVFRANYRVNTQAAITNYKEMVREGKDLLDYSEKHLNSIKTPKFVNAYTRTYTAINDKFINVMLTNLILADPNNNQQRECAMFLRNSDKVDREANNKSIKTMIEYVAKMGFGKEFIGKTFDNTADLVKVLNNDNIKKEYLKKYNEVYSELIANYEEKYNERKPLLDRIKSYKGLIKENLTCIKENKKEIKKAEKEIKAYGEVEDPRDTYVKDRNYVIKHGKEDNERYQKEIDSYLYDIEEVEDTLEGRPLHQRSEAKKALEAEKKAAKEKAGKKKAEAKNSKPKNAKKDNASKKQATKKNLPHA
ncbi:MAG: hypothetical protein K5656_04985 [Lachnospiraceae bacterium]|nr:hypothetical protein [Lachnospiraceae bacterium]